MRFLVLITFLCCISFSIAKHHVIELTDSDFQSRVSDMDTALVMFYAPWCGHCKRLKPEFEKAASLLQGNDPPITLAKVDCTEGGKDTCNQFSVSGYPTLKIFRAGEMSQEYQGPREANGIVKYMQSQVGPSSKDLSSSEDFEKFIGKDDVAVVGGFEQESDLKGAFLKAADKLREKVRFAHSSDKGVLAKLGVSDGIVLIRPKHLDNKFEPSKVTYDGPATKDGIEKFIKDNYHGLVGHRTRDNAGDFKSPLVIAYFAVDYVKNPKGTNYWRNRIMKVASELADDFSFAISAKEDFQNELNDFGIDYVPGDAPLVFARNAKDQKFAMKSEFTVDSFKQFLNDLKAGLLEPFLKSEAIPEDNDGPVKVAVARNFEELVTNSGRDALVEFYAPWCGHCKSLAPVYDELGEKLDKEDVDIVKMDATANDVPPEYNVRGFPTLYWSPKNSKSSPIRYEGGRELTDFIKYIAKHSTDGLKGYDRSGNAVKEEL